MRTLTAALVSLLALASRFGTPRLVIPTASGAEARLEGNATSSTPSSGGGQDGGDDDDDDDDDDEDFRAIG